MNKRTLNLDPQKKIEYIKELVELSEFSRTHGLLALKDQLEDKEGFIQECLRMIIEGYCFEDFKQIANQRVSSLVSYIDGQINLIIAGSLAVYGQKSEKVVDLTIKSHSFSNLSIDDEGHVACCSLIKNWPSSILKVDELNLSVSVKLFCLYAQELFVSEVNPGDVILLLNQKKMSVLKEFRQTLELILIGILSIEQGDNPVITQRKLDCLSHNDFFYPTDPPEKELSSIKDCKNTNESSHELVRHSGQVSKNLSIEFILKNLSKSSMQALISQIDYEHLVEILVHEPDTVQTLVSKSMSDVAAGVLKADIKNRSEYGGFRNLEELHLNFIHLIFKFIEDGNIILGLGK
ncbi:MAG: hypothetical protein KC646_02700 [Candidatus Cloacimonetes bacterium]|nr:hypothetical protein [Candidatus Cloacimonadota bacterium]